MAKKHMTDLKCKSTVYITPDKILEPVRQYWGGPIPLDPATEPDNPTSAANFAAGPHCNGTSLGDGLAISWSDFDGTFLNPPYGKELKHWCEKIHDETDLGATILALLPCGPRFATKYWQEHIFNAGLDVTLFVRGRVQFRRPDGSGTQGSNPYDSQLLGFNVDVDHFAKCFGHLGKVVKMEVA
jgi:DNA N-6-adenine-methyltransferase Dam